MKSQRTYKIQNRVDDLFTAYLGKWKPLTT